MREKNSVSRFYASKKWKRARQIRIAYANGLCEKCGAIGTEVHHIIHLTPDNINDPNITINQDNLILLCNECHNKEHNRFEGKRDLEFDADGNVISKKKHAPPGADEAFFPSGRGVNI